MSPESVLTQEIKRLHCYKQVMVTNMKAKLKNQKNRSGGKKQRENKRYKKLDQKLFHEFFSNQDFNHYAKSKYGIMIQCVAVLYSI